MHKTDVVIIGAGPVGLFAVFECGMLGLSCHVVDALPMVGGQCSALYPQKPIYDIPAYPAITAQELVEKLRTQAAPFKPQYHLGEKVVTASETENGWQVETDKGTVIEAATVMIAAGGGFFGPNRPPIKDIEAFEDSAVFYMVDDKERYRDKRVVIAGGGDSAVDWAVELSEIARDVTLVHRRDKFRAAPDSVAKLRRLQQDGKITLETPCQLKGLTGAKGKLEFVGIEDMDGHGKELPADFLLPFYGLAMDLGPLADWGLDVDKGRLVVNPATLETNRKGIFAIGDIAHYKGKLKLILTGFSESAMAAHAAFKYARPDEVLELTHSTDKGIQAI